MPRSFENRSRTGGYRTAPGLGSRVGGGSRSDRVARWRGQGPTPVEPALGALDYPRSIAWGRGRGNLRRMRSSCIGRRRPGRLLAIKAPGECLTLLIVQKHNGNNDCLAVLIIFELRRLVSDAIEPLAHDSHRTRKPCAPQPDQD